MLFIALEDFWEFLECSVSTPLSAVAEVEWNKDPGELAWTSPDSPQPSDFASSPHAFWWRVYKIRKTIRSQGGRMDLLVCWGHFSVLASPEPRWPFGGEGDS